MGAWGLGSLAASEPGGLEFRSRVVALGRKFRSSCSGFTIWCERVRLCSVGSAVDLRGVRIWGLGGRPRCSLPSEFYGHFGQKLPGLEAVLI